MANAESKPSAKPTGYGRTMKAAHQVARAGGQEIAKADELVMARFDRESAALSLPAMKVFNLMLAAAASDAWRDQAHMISRGQLRVVGNMPNKEIEAVLDELAALRVKIEGESARGRMVLRRRPVFRSIDEETSDRDDDMIEFQFDHLVRGILARSDHYTKLLLRTILSFDSKYALRLYEIGSRYVRLPDFTWEGTIDDLKELLGVPPKAFKGWNDFRRFVLERAITEVNQVAQFTAGWEIRQMAGRTIKRIALAFVYKDEAGIEAAHRTVAAPRAERRSRRKGGNEKVIKDIAK